MKALRRSCFALFLAAAAWAQDALVSVTCGRAWLSVAVPADVLGKHLAAGELTLGAGCGVTAADGDRYRLQHPLVGCGTTLELLPDGIRYSNVLRYRPSAGGPAARAGPFSLPVFCYYPRTGSVSSGAVQPAWVSFGSSVARRRRLRFALDAYDSSWVSRPFLAGTDQHRGVGERPPPPAPRGLRGRARGQPRGGGRRAPGGSQRPPRSPGSARSVPAAPGPR